jgi:hypothetical protein
VIAACIAGTIDSGPSPPLEARSRLVARRTAATSKVSGWIIAMLPL